MIYTDDPDGLKQKLQDAVSVSFSGCLYLQEYRAVTSAVVEFLSALNLTQGEVRSALKQADGMDADTDRCIDEIIKAFDE